MNLFELAGSNVSALEEEFENLLLSLNTSETEAIESFARQVHQEGRISINMRQTVLLDFLESGELRNIHEQARAMAQESGGSFEEILKERLGKFYEKRRAFDGSFDNGEEFKYGALNIGGLGATGYGDHCAILTDKVSSENSEAAYLMSDSLTTQNYWNPGPAVNEEAVAKELSPHSHRQHLCALKHARDIAGTEQENWPCLLCDDDEYVEAIFIGAITPKELEKVRISKDLHKTLFDYIVDEYRERLAEEKRCQVDTFNKILDHLDDLGISLETVEDA